MKQMKAHVLECVACSVDKLAEVNLEPPQCFQVLVLAVTVLGAGATKIRSRANESSQALVQDILQE